MLQTEHSARVLSLQGVQRIQNAQLIEVLSQTLAIKKSAMEIYRAAMDRAQTPDLRVQLERYFDMTQRHQDLIEGMIRELGGNPGDLSQLGQLEAGRIRPLLEQPVPTRYQPIYDIENLLRVETHERANLGFLQSILPYLSAPEAREIVTGRLTELSGDESERLSWLERTLNRLLLQQLGRQSQAPEDAA